MAEVNTDGRIECQICNAKVHSMQLHIRNEHPEWTLDKYIESYPGAPVLSEPAKRKLEEASKLKQPEKSAVGSTKLPLHEVFSLGGVKAAVSARGEPIPITVLDSCEHPELIPDIDNNYVFDIESLKSVLLAIELQMRAYVWGHAGTGKTTLLEQICARTKRPLLRVQHTLNTEESHIVGQWTAKGGETKFELGPLALAMKHGWVYLADEYDFALPSVLSVYQPVLEGKSLVIKEADAENRIIRPHENFRFVATGNTNGSGDETGLYQGTSIQNAANYDRFEVVLQARYMAHELEARILTNQAKIPESDAKRIVEFASRVREGFEGGKLSSTISPRALIAAAKIGRRRDSYRAGLNLAYMNKLSRVDREVVDGFAQRIFG